MPITYGPTFLLGQTFPEDGIFFRVTTEAVPPAGIVPLGIAAIGFRGLWGPLETPTLVQELADVDIVFGSGGTTDLLRQALNGGAQQVVAYRLGSGGTTTSFTLANTAGGNGVIIPLAYPGSRGPWYYQLKDSVIFPGQREFDLYEGTTLRATVVFTKGSTVAGGAGEAGALMRAINASGSPWLGVATLGTPTPSDTSTLATVSTNTAATVVGTDPTVTGTDFTNMQTALTNYAFNTLAIDTNDMATLASFAAYASNQEALGKRFLAVLAEGSTVARATRITDSLSFNSYRVVYYGNGFTNANNTGDGVYGAAQLAGRIAGTDIGKGITGEAINGATGVLDPFNLIDYRTAIQSGMLVARINQANQVVWGEQVTTYITPDSNHTPSYDFISVVRVYDYLQDAIFAAWDPLLRRRNNTPRTRRLLLAAANNVINQLVAAEALLSAIIIEDPNNPPVGRRAWFRLGALAAQPLEQAYVTLEVDFAGTTPQELGAVPG